MPRTTLKNTLVLDSDYQVLNQNEGILKKYFRKINIHFYIDVFNCMTYFCIALKPLYTLFCRDMNNRWNRHTCIYMLFSLFPLLKKNTIDFVEKYIFVLLTNRYDSSTIFISSYQIGCITLNGSYDLSTIINVFKSLIMLLILILPDQGW